MSYLIQGPGEQKRSTYHRNHAEVPLNNEGEPYRYCLIMPDQHDFLYTDTWEGMLNGLIPGYENETDEVELAVMRIRYAGQAAAVTQANILSSVNLEELTTEERDTLFAPRLGKHAARTEWWTSEIPLVVVETSYEPFTMVPRPASSKDGVKNSNIWWVRPVETEDFLLSLHEIGFVTILENFDIEDNVYGAGIIIKNSLFK